MNSTTFNDIIEKYRKDSFSQRDKGTRFERLMQAYLLTDPKYAAIFKKVDLWNEFSAKENFGGKDIGIDLVAQTFDGEFWAVQCKCFQENSYIDKPAVDTFLSTSSRKFTDENFQQTQFSHRLWISTTNKWNPNAEETIKNQNPPVSRVNLYDLQSAAVDWEKLENGIHGEFAQVEKKQLRQHQTDALLATHKHFQTADRGKLIMACGTGKTFTALRIAENETNGKGLILFLVPSIALIGQTLNEWYANAIEPINAVCVCSDPEITKKRNKNEDTDSTSIVDLALPASTNVHYIVNQFRMLQCKKEKNGMIVVFSTYQSIGVIANAQKELKKDMPQFAEFDLIICDEAHRTTGVTLCGEDESAFMKVHDNDFLHAKKRLYMTATPRLYSDDTKSKAAQVEAVLCSMDDIKMYGDEIYRIGFGEAVEKALLADYKVLILTLNQNDVPPAVQKIIADKESEINTDDASKLIGCINALSKQILGDDGSIKETDPEPMRRAVAFCPSIVASKKITNMFNDTSETYIQELPPEKQEYTQRISSKHIDGTMDAMQRCELMSWLKDTPDENECKVLTNVRCLSEGVDVPSLDAVMFLSAKNSQVEVVQSVGRVMRKAEGKKYGYIIIPVVIPTDEDANKALDNNERYKVVWTVLNALRAHDDRFNATVNKIELNKKKPPNIIIGRPPITFPPEGNSSPSTPTDGGGGINISQGIIDIFGQLQNVIFAKMVQKVGDRRYWEQWAKSVAEIAERQIERITKLIKYGEYKQAFEEFLYGLQKNINPSITENDAIEMLSQHIITKPVFEALFEDYSFVRNNPISISMQSMLETLEAQAMEKDTEILQKFYESVKMRASGIDNAEGKQRIVIELYDKFFKTAFPKMVERLGIVYTPVEVVDFIIHSVNDILKQEFGRNISDENVNILDPFTGTGTFITRLIQSGLINKTDLERKYHHELFANEIVLLAYYIAAVNIENAYHDSTESKDYHPFGGICLTDTFQLGEVDEYDEYIDKKYNWDFKTFQQNSERLERQRNTPITIIMGNPPYSIGQKSANDNAQNQEYPKLENRIAETYCRKSDSHMVAALYDSYIKAFRWSADRLGNNYGIVAFVSNGAWLDGNAASGFRKCLEEEFSSIYVFNLRGNCRTQGELRRKEAGNVFGLGSRTLISITLLVKSKNQSQNKANIYYHDIGDYLTREEKLKKIKDFCTIRNIDLSQLSPNEHGDWINQRNSTFGTFIELGDKKNEKQVFFTIFSSGFITNRDSWLCNFSSKSLSLNISNLIYDYNEALKNKKDFQSAKIKWDQSLIEDFNKNIKHEFNEKWIRPCNYRPFCKINTYYDKDLMWSRYLLPKLFPEMTTKNIVIGVSGTGSTKDFSCIVLNNILDRGYLDTIQCFPLYYYEENKTIQTSLFDTPENQYTRHDAISDFILKRAKKQYGKNVTKEDIFYYVYGFLHSPKYRETFANDLKKMLPRLPLVEDVRDFWEFSKAGRKLAELHLNYENLGKYNGVVELLTPLNIDGALSQANSEEMEYLNYRVQKMIFGKNSKETDKSKIIYNSQISLERIPAEAYEYVVNGKSAIEWIMERYQITTHKESGIVNNPNDWAKENGKPRYILDLLHSVINLSVQTVEIVKGLPDVEFGGVGEAEIIEFSANEDGFKLWIEEVGFAARGDIDEQTLRNIYNAIDQDDR